MEMMMRNFFLFLSKNRMLTKMSKKYGRRFGAARFVAGETIDEVVQVIKNLNESNLSVTIDHLGEFISSGEEANEMTLQVIKAIKAIRHKQLDSQISVKLTSLGMDISNEIVMRNMQRILRVAEENDVFVTIDMEDYAHCQRTLDLFKQLKKEFHHVGTVIQAYLYRSEKDIEDLRKYSPHLRLVKGAYKESKEVAYPMKKDVDENFKKIIKMHLINGNYTAIATHDDQIIEYTKQIIREHKIPTDQCEFQMLYGIRPEKQMELAKQGYKMRVYVPYGGDWYGYFMRRLAERPANVLFVLKGMMRK
ncbi:proline dehydrogenase [Oikeobacillus pervagus]|nr:proline dehydrogenase [Oikeobacillus pervagus]